MLLNNTIYHDVILREQPHYQPMAIIKVSETLKDSDWTSAYISNCFYKVKCNNGHTAIRNSKIHIIARPLLDQCQGHKIT